MSVTATLRLVLAPPHSAGYRFIGAGVVGFVVGLVVAGWLACVSNHIHWHGPSEELTDEELHTTCELGAYHRHVETYHVGEGESLNDKR